MRRTCIDEIISMYPHLNHTRVFDALSYYYDNKEDVDKLIAENDLEFWRKETRNDPWQK